MDDLLIKCLAGEKAAWDEFVDRYAAVIFAAVRRVLGKRGPAGGEAETEDLVQDVFLRLVKNDFHLLRSFDASRASLVTWLTIVARSTAIDSLRRRRLPTTPLEEIEPPAPPQPVAPAPATADLPRGVLTARERLILHLIFDRDMDAAEAAAVLGISPQTVRSTKHKAIQKLRKHFEVKDST